MPDRHTLATGWRPTDAVRNNGLTDLAIERFKLRELAEGWPMYRDYCEWENLESIFAPDACKHTNLRVSWRLSTPSDTHPRHLHFMDRQDPLQRLHRSL